MSRCAFFVFAGKHKLYSSTDKVMEFEFFSDGQLGNCNLAVVAITVMLSATRHRSEHTLPWRVIAEHVKRVLAEMEPG